MIETTREILKEKLDFPYNIPIKLVGVIPGHETCYGLYTIPSALKKEEIMIKAEQAPWEIVCTVAHELVHAEQYKQGRLQVIGNNTYWPGPFPEIPLRPTYLVFLPPWEQEAWIRMLELTDYVLSHPKFKKHLEFSE